MGGCPDSCTMRSSRSLLSARRLLRSFSSILERVRLDSIQSDRRDSVRISCASALSARSSAACSNAIEHQGQVHIPSRLQQWQLIGLFSTSRGSPSPGQGCRLFLVTGCAECSIVVQTTLSTTLNHWNNVIGLPKVSRSSSSPNAREWQTIKHVLLALRAKSVVALEEFESYVGWVGF